MISFRAAARGWGHNVSPTAVALAREPLGSLDDPARSTIDAPAGGAVGTDPDAEPSADDAPAEESGDAEPHDDAGNGRPEADEPVPAADAPWRVHPLGYVAAGLLVLAIVYHTVLDTKYLIGNLEAWHWVLLVVLLALSSWAPGLNGLRVGIESVASVTKRISMFLAWFVFFVQFFNVVTRYGTRYVEQDILIGEATSLAWQSFAALFLLGAAYGIRDGINPRIDFWWANFSDKRKAWIDFVLHAALFLPFVLMAIRILQPYAAISLGRKRDGTWPSGYRVWETWEQSSDADQLPVGPIKALLLVGFVLIAIQLVAELIKTGFVIANRPHYGFKRLRGDAPQRIE